jgi:hypothetical protein
MLHLNRTYFYCALGLLVIELYIGLFVHDALVRPYGGDFLVVMLLYCLLRAFSSVSRRYAASAVLLLAYATEVTQYYHLIQQLSWEQHLWVRLLLGTHFAWLDLLAYTAGIAVVVTAEQVFQARTAVNSV